MTMRAKRLMSSAMAALAGGAVLLAGPGGPAAPAPQSQQQSEVNLSISGESGARPRYAVPDFIARAGDTETLAAAKLMGAVLWDDLAFEREFYMVPRDTYRTIPAARSLADIPFDRWRELGVDGLVTGSVERTGAGHVPCRGAAVRRALAALGDGEGVQRHHGEPAALRAHGVRRHPPAAAGAARRRPIAG